MSKKLYFGLFAGILFFLAISTACYRGHTPKPRGYYRISFPEKKYLSFSGTCPYSFEYPVYGEVVKDDEKGSEPCWININFPAYNGTIHISYKPVSNNLNSYLEDSYVLAYKHTVKAESIMEQLILNSDKNVYGILYDIEGSTASSVQFFLTDSTQHFLRGALYFRTAIDKDSLAPIIEFFREDVVHFINTFEWN
ncbi:MAG: gliding motility lipoprotein GldD [Bacteroidota bacterium]|nr:gliding motility lipoprotein GldD [Bacteroidota bacterium]